MKVIINELKKFSLNILDLGTSIKDNRIEKFEFNNQINLPEDFKEFMKEINGFSLMGTEVYCFDEDKANSIEKLYEREHFQVNFPQYPKYVPFSADGRGNFYCLDTYNLAKDKKLCPVIFWVSNYEYTIEDQPELAFTTFGEWIEEVVIAWTLEDFDYSGNEK